MIPTPDVERQLLGILLTSPATATRAVVSELGLKPDHFLFDRDKATFDAILNLVDRDVDSPDAVLVAEELGGDEQISRHLLEIVETCDVPHANPVPFAESVIKRAEWRRISAASGLLAQAVKESDDQKLAEARDQLTSNVAHRRFTMTPDDLRNRLEEILQGSAKKDFPFPIKRLNELSAGGLGRGEHHTIAGHSSHGKSVWVDQLLNYWGFVFKCHLYTNEMNLDSRLVRQVNRGRDLSFTSILSGRLNDRQKDKVRELGRRNLIFGITDVTGWTAREIANDIRLNRWDVAAVDLLHNVAPEPSDTNQEQTLNNAARLLTDTCRQADCLVITVGHLNESRTHTAEKPRPTLGDIRGSGMIKNAADSVSFVWRKQDLERGLPDEQGEITLAKVRNGMPGWVEVRLDPGDLLFQELDKVHQFPEAA